MTADSLLLVFHVHVLSVDHAFVLLLTAAVAARSRAVCWTARPTTRRTLRLRCLVHFLGQLVRSLGQVLASLIHLRLVVRFQRLLGISHRILHIATIRTRNLVARIAHHLLDALNNVVQLVLGVDRLTLSLV